MKQHVHRESDIKYSVLSSCHIFTSFQEVKSTQFARSQKLIREEEHHLRLVYFYFCCQSVLKVKFCQTLSYKDERHFIYVSYVKSE